MVSDLYVKLRELQVKVTVDNGSLNLNAPKGVLTPELLTAIKENKAELIALISSYKEQKADYNAIHTVPLQESYPLSPSQYRLWIMSQFEESNVAYNTPGVYVFEGQLDLPSLEYSLHAMIARHDSLRTVFREEQDGSVRQVIKTPGAVDFSIGYHDLRGDEDRQPVLDTLMRQAALQPFDLAAGPLFRVNLYQLEDRQWVFSYVVHHIIIDAWSMVIFINELLQLYNSRIKGTPDPLPPLRIQYKDYVAWQDAQLSGESFKAHKAYWLKQFEGDLPVLDFAGDKPRPALQKYNGGTVNKQLDARVSSDMRALIRQEGTTLFIGLLAAVNALLYKYTGLADIITGTPIAGREHADLEDQIGYFGNTLALRLKFSGADSYRQLLEHTKQTVLGAHEHQVYPFAQLVEDLQLKRDMSRNPLFDVQVIVGQSGVKDKQQRLGDLHVRQYEEELRTSRFDMVFNFAEAGDGLLLNVQYSTDIYSAKAVERIITHLEQLMAAITAGPDKPVDQLSCISIQEQEDLLVGFSGKIEERSREGTVLQLFAEQVAQNPDAVAVIFEQVKLTYKELDESSNQLAHYLLANYQLQANEMVGIMVDRSEKMFIGILGILKAGAAYVPVDPEYPRSRKEYIIRDTGIKVLLTQSDYLFDIDFYEGTAFAMDIQLDILETSTGAPEREPQQEDLAYVIYTSGSTGDPKGVLITHGNLFHSTFPRATVYPAVHCFLLLSSISFDSSVAGIFGTLCNGGSLALTRKMDVANVALIADFIATHRVSHLLTVPSYYKLLLKELENKEHALSQVIVAGETCPTQLVMQHYSTPSLQHCDLFNEYGPTECAVWSTVHRYDPDNVQLSTIGKPISNTRLYILDNRQQLVPVGVPGEICIGGGGLAKGYLNQPALTSKKFVPDPFREGAKMYRTGDLAKWLPDGNIMFLGRMDDQVKIRGFRIELGEIEAALQQYPAVESAVVIARAATNGDTELIAYVVGNEALNSTDLQSYLNKILPVYAVPPHFVQLEQWPLTPNGKVDKKRLPDPVSSAMATGVTYVAPRNEIEQQLTEVFEEVLKKQPIGIKEDFFILGGDSIKSIQIVSRLKQRGYTLAIQDILLSPVIEQLAERVKPNTRTIDQGIVEGSCALGPIQSWFFDNSFPEKHHFNQSVLLVAKKRLSEKGVKAAVDKLVAHHDALRMVFRKGPDGWAQENRGKDHGYAWEVIPYAEEEVFNIHCDRLQSTIDLEKGPLFRVALFKGKEEDRLLLVAHHLVIDGVSWRILFEDLSNLYHQYQLGVSLALPQKTDSFKYWQDQLSAYAATTTLQEEHAYWSAIEAFTEVATLPQDHPNGSNLVKDTAVQSFLLDRETTNRLLTKTYEAYRTEINDVLIAALGLAMKDVFGLPDLLLQLEGHGRENIGVDTDVSRTVGWFTTIYPVLINLHYSEEPIRQLIEVKETLHRVPNKGIGYGVLRYLAASPYKCAPQVSFNYLGDFGGEIKVENGEPLFEFSAAYKGNEIPDEMPRDTLLDISGMTVAGQTRLSIAYSSAKYEAATIRRLIRSWQQQLESLIMQLAEEKEQLTPVDLTFKGLSVEQLKQLNEIL